MKVKSSFTQNQVDTIINLIKEKMEANATKQKAIRRKIRNIGFYFTDFYKRGSKYDTASFENLIKSNKISIIP